MTLLTFQPRVFASKDVSRLAMIEGLDVPLHQGEVFTVVFRVAACAFMARSRGNVVGGVQPSVRRQAPGDFGVTVEALERGLSAELVAAGAVRRSGQGLMWPRERAG